MLIGLDFDNTIVCYDQLFHTLALERDLIPPTLPRTKQAVRDHLRKAGRESAWTQLQGIAYGPRITDANPFPGVREFLQRCRRAEFLVAIISHKTRRPYRGEGHDLHAAAHTFLNAHGFYQTAETGLSPECVFLELTLAAKLARIETLGCDAFVDDLPELLAEPTFPPATQRVLFDPAHAHPDEAGYWRVGSWTECGDRLLRPRRAAA